MEQSNSSPDLQRAGLALDRKLRELEDAQARLLSPEAETAAPVQYGKRAGDHIAEAADRSARLEAASQLRRLEVEVRAALAQVGRGAYGRCAGCGQPIPAERLEVLPWATHCVVCQSRERSTGG
ncbi:MAG: TraR/DksA family transcriptional regulator [Candidatus Dormibacteria bacterium]